MWDEAQQLLGVHSLQVSQAITREAQRVLQGQGLGGAQGQRQHDAAIDGAPLTRLACGSHLPSGLGLQGQEHSLPQNLTLPWASHREHTQVQARKPRTRELSPVPVAANPGSWSLGSQATVPL